MTHASTGHEADERGPRARVGWNQRNEAAGPPRKDTHSVLSALTLVSGSGPVGGLTSAPGVARVEVGYSRLYDRYHVIVRHAQSVRTVEENPSSRNPTLSEFLPWA